MRAKSSRPTAVAIGAFKLESLSKAPPHPPADKMLTGLALGLVKILGALGVDTRFGFAPLEPVLEEDGNVVFRLDYASAAVALSAVPGAEHLRRGAAQWSRVEFWLDKALRIEDNCPILAGGQVLPNLSRLGRSDIHQTLWASRAYKRWVTERGGRRMPFTQKEEGAIAKTFRVLGWERSLGTHVALGWSTTDVPLRTGIGLAHDRFIGALVDRAEQANSMASWPPILLPTPGPFNPLDWRRAKRICADGHEYVSPLHVILGPGAQEPLTWENAAAVGRAEKGASLEKVRLGVVAWLTWDLEAAKVLGEAWGRKIWMHPPAGASPGLDAAVARFLEAEAAARRPA